MKKTVLLFFILCFSNCLFSQRISSIKGNEKYKDSLIQVVKTTKNDSIKSYCSFELVVNFKKDNETEKIDQYLQIGKKYAQKYPYLRDCTGYFESMKLMDSPNLEPFANKIAETLKKIKKYNSPQSYKLQTIIIQNLSIYNNIIGNRKEAIRLLVEEGIPVSIKDGNQVMRANLYKMIATNMINNSDREKASEYYEKSIKLLENQKSHDPFLIETIIEINIATGENLLNLNKLQNGRKFLDKAFSVLKHYPKSNLNSLYIKANGFYFYKSKQFNKALECYEKGILEIQKSKNFDVREMSGFKYGKFEALFELKKYQQAKLVLIDLIKTKSLSPFAKNDYKLKLSKTLEKIGDFEQAYFNAKEYIAVNDSIVTTKTQKEVMLFEAKFNKSENENKIKHLKIEKDKIALIAQNYRMRYISFATIFLVSLILLFFIISNLKNKNKLAKAIDSKNQQQIISLKSQKEIEVMQAMINGEEAERKRIARDLHDGIGSRLSALKMQMKNSLINQNNDFENNNFYEMLDNSIIELRQIAFNLMPETLIKLGLELALKDLCHSLESEKTTIVFQSSKIDDTISQTNQIAIFRIIQELINNALKHAKCSEIIIDCNQNGTIFLITVEDNGIGLNVKSIENFSGLGLKNIKNRIDLLNGKLEIKNAKTSGTIINIELCL